MKPTILVGTPRSWRLPIAAVLTTPGDREVIDLAESAGEPIRRAATAGRAS